MNISPLKLLVVFLFLIPISCRRDSPHPSDDALKRNFESHEADFDKLLRMCTEDAVVVRIDSEFTWTVKSNEWPRPDSELGFSKERWDDYRSLFQKVGLSGGIKKYRPEVIYFTASKRGTEGKENVGSSKGYAYSIDVPSEVVDSLDDHRFHNTGRAFLKLKGNWYLYFDVWD